MRGNEQTPKIIAALIVAAIVVAVVWMLANVGPPPLAIVNSGRTRSLAGVGSAESERFPLKAGTYVLTLRLEAGSTSCTGFAGVTDADTPGGILVLAGALVGEVATHDETQALQQGNYYFNVDAPCPWRVSLTPTP